MDRERFLAQTLIQLAVYFENSQLWSNYFKCRCCNFEVESITGIRREDLLADSDDPFDKLLVAHRKEELLIDFPHKNGCPVLKAVEVLKENAIP